MDGIFKPSSIGATLSGQEEERGKELSHGVLPFPAIYFEWVNIDLQLEVVSFKGFFFFFFLLAWKIINTL